MKTQKIFSGTGTSKMIKAAALALTLMALGNSAQAALVPCPATYAVDPTSLVEDATKQFTAVGSCQYLNNPDTNNVANQTNINAAGFFGTTSWSINGMNGQLPGGNPGLTGTWAISGVDFSAYDYMIVFKDGSGTNLVGFLLNEVYANGTWSSPFMKAAFSGLNNNQIKGVSHYTIAQRTGIIDPPCAVGDPDCDPNEIPEPGSIALMALGMIGAGVALKRRRSRRAE